MTKTSAPLAEKGFTNAENCGILKANEENWVTINGTPVQVGEDGKLMGEVGAKIEAFNTAKTKATAGHMTADEKFGEDANSVTRAYTTAQELSANLGREVSIDEASALMSNVQAYTDIAYRDIRKVRKAYTNPERASAEQLSMLTSLETFIEGSPTFEGENLMRGVSLSDERFSALVPGHEFDMRGPSSWTTDTGTAMEFMVPSKGEQDLRARDGRTNLVRYEIAQTRQGTSITHLSDYPDEQEVLVSSKSRFRVVETVADTTSNNQIFTRVMLEEIS
ncbi:MAG: hypothetical protein FWB93_01985 [Oscillospiraceae bacterium]|nr:hypothetical protein [Oscillospiraceae bacterium]